MIKFKEKTKSKFGLKLAGAAAVLCLALMTGTPAWAAQETAQNSDETDTVLLTDTVTSSDISDTGYVTVDSDAETDELSYGESADSSYEGDELFDDEEADTTEEPEDSKNTILTDSAGTSSDTSADSSDIVADTSDASSDTAADTSDASSDTAAASSVTSAETTISIDEDAVSDQTNISDPSVTNPLAPKTGSAEIVEYSDSKSEAATQGTNAVDSLISAQAASNPEAQKVNKNDVPDVEYVVSKDLNTGEITDSYWALSETGQCVEIDEATYPLPKTTTTEVGATVDAIQTTTVRYYSQNAIQKAIDTALNGIWARGAGQAFYEVTIAVDDGEYDGDITIAPLDNDSYWDNVTLYILSRDSYTSASDSKKLSDKTTINAGGSSGVNVNGSLSIKGIHTVLAGLTFSSDQTLLVEDTKAVIYGTEEADDISLVFKGDSTGNSASAEVCSGAGNDTINISEYSSETLIPFEKAAAEGTLTVDTGAGDDVVNLDITAADTLTTVQTNGTGRLHFTGTLQDNAKDSKVEKTSSSEYRFTFVNADGKKMTLSSNGFTRITDQLENKKAVAVTAANIVSDSSSASGKMIRIDASSENTFTEYVLDPYTLTGALYDTNHLIDVYVSGEGLLTDLAINDSASQGLKISRIEASGMEVLITCPDVEFVSGSLVKAANLLVVAKVNDSYLSKDIKDKIASGKLFDTSAEILVDNDARLITSGDIVFLINVEQTQNINMAASASMLNVKVGKTKVVIDGSMTAGGSVLVTASNKVIIASNRNILAEYGANAACDVSLAGSTIDVNENGVILAKGSVELSASTNVDLTAKAALGNTIPGALGIAIISNETHVDVKGSVTAETGSVILSAESINKLESGASGGLENRYIIYVDENGKETGESSGILRQDSALFFAISVANVNTYAAITGNGSVSAGTDIDINSKSEVINAANARTAGALTAGTSPVADEKIDNAGNLALGMLDLLQKTFSGGEDEAKWNTINELLVSKMGYSITIETSANGTVSAPTRAKEGTIVEVNLVPADGYTVDKVYVIEYQNQANITRELSSLKNEDGTVCYEFAMPTCAVTLRVTYKAKTDADPVISNRAQGEGQISAEDAYKQAMQQRIGETVYQDSVMINAAERSEEEREQGIVFSNTICAGAGQTIYFDQSKTNEEYTLKSITLTYTLNNIKMTETVAKSAAGYIYVLPDELTSGTILYTPVYEKKTGETTDDSIAGDKNGAFSIGVIINRNNAYISTTGTVKAAGNLTLEASGTTQSSVWADASSVTQDIEKKTKNLVDKSGVSESETVQKSKTETVVIDSELDNSTYTFNLNYSAASGGTYEFVKDTEDVYGFEFAVKPDDGYQVKKAQIIFSYDNGKLEYFNLKQDEETKNYVIDGGFLAKGISKIDYSKYSQYARVAVVFEGISHKVALDQTQKGNYPTSLELPSSAGTGDTVKIQIPTEGDGADYTYVVTDDSSKAAVRSEVSDGVLSFIMPNADVTIKGTKKSNQVLVDLGDDYQNALTVQSYAAPGETVSVKAGTKLSYGGVDYSLVAYCGDEEIEIKDGSFLVPADLAAGTAITIRFADNGAPKQKAIEVDFTTKVGENGSAGGTVRVNAGDILTVVLTPNSGYAIDTENCPKIGYFTQNGGAVAPLQATSTAGVYTLKLDDDITADKIYIYASFKEGTTASGKTTALGVGIAVGVFRSVCNAYIDSGNIEANSISLNAQNGTDGRQVKSEVLSNAGYSCGYDAFAGAVSVNVANITTKAVIEKKGDTAPQITIGSGKLSLTSNCRSQVITKAEAAEAKDHVTRNSVGAGIAVSVSNVVTKSSVADGIAINQKNGESMDSVTVTASSVHSETISAKAGSAGGSSIVPAAAAVVSGVKTDAYIGTSDTPMKIAGDAVITSSTAVSRTVASDAGSKAADGALGGAITVTVVTDTAETKVNRDMEAKNISLRATARTSTTTTAKASSKGGRSKGASGSSSGSNGKQDADADADADLHLTNALRLAAMFGEGNGNAASGSNAAAGRQKAETSEGNVTAAGAINVNVQTTKAIAEIGDGLTIKTSGKLSLISAARSDAYVTATSEAVGSETGVGVSVGVNVVTLVNEALIGASKIEAGSIELAAITPVTSKETLVMAVNPAADNILSQYVKNALTKGFEKILKDTGTDQRVKNLINVVISTCESLVTKISETLITGTGLKNLISSDVIANIRDILTKTGGCSEEDLKDAALDIGGHALNVFVNYALAQMSQYFLSDEMKTVQPELIPESYNFSNEVKRELANLAQEYVGKLIDVNQFWNFIKGNWKEQLYNNFKTACKKTQTVLGTFAVNSVLALLDVKAETETGNANRSVIFTQAISGAGKSDVGVAGSVALTITNNTVKAEIASVSAEDREKYPVTVSGNIIIKANDKIKITSTASSACDGNGNADTNSSGASTSDLSDGSGVYEAHCASNADYVTFNQTSHGQFIDIAELGNNKFTVRIKPDEGYELKNNRISYNVTYEGEDNVKASSDTDGGTYDDNTGYLVFTVDLQNEKKISALHFNAEFIEQVITIDCGKLIGGSVSAVDEAGNVITLDNNTKVRTGQKLLITLTPDSGNTFDSFTYSSYDPEVNDHTALTETAYAFNKTGGNTLVIDLPYFANLHYDLIEDTYKDEYKVPVLYLQLLFTGIDSDHPALTEDSKITPTGAKIGVGASFALNVENSDVTASIGDNRLVTAAAVEISAVNDHSEAANAVAGTDPLSGKAPSQGAADTGIDGAVAISIINSDTNSTTGENVSITTTKGNHIILSYVYAKDKDDNYIKDAKGNFIQVPSDAINFYMISGESGTASSYASSYAVGANDAVGASLALTIDDSDVNTIFRGSMTAQSTDADVRILSRSSKTDTARSAASSNGADMQQYFNKFISMKTKSQTILNKAVTGDYDLFNSEAKKDSSNNNNNTASRINQYLNANKSDTGSDAIQSLPTSVNVLKTLGVSSDNVDQDEVNDQIEQAADDADLNALDNQVNTQPAQKYQFAAVVSVAVLNHDIDTKVLGNITAGSVKIDSDLKSNFNTLATAASMTTARSASSIAAAAAVCADKNITDTYVSGKIISTRKTEGTSASTNITIHSSLVENLAQGFSSKIAAQTISGAVTGADSSKTIAGAVSIVKSDAETNVTLAKGSVITADDSGSVNISAYNKSKLAVKAGAVSVSKQTAYGIGASFALLYDNSRINVKIGDKDPASGNFNAEDTSVNAGKLVISSKKDEVNWSDRSNPFGISFLVTKTVTGQPNPAAGIVNFEQNPKTKTYTATINVSSDTFINLLTGLNALINMNDYVEAISGSMISDSSAGTDVSAAGSIAMLFYKADVSVIIGDGFTAVIAGDATLESSDITTAWATAGAASIAPSSDTAGITVASIDNHGNTEISLGNHVTITTGSWSQSAHRDNTAISVAAAASVTTGSATTDKSIGGSINVVNLQNTVQSTVGSGTVITAKKGDIVITADEENYAVLVSFSTSGTQADTAAGTTIGVLVAGTNVTARTGNSSVLDAGAAGNVKISATGSDKLVNVLASAAPAPKSDLSLTGVVGITVGNSRITAQVGDKAQIKAKKNIDITASSDNWIFTLDMALALSDSKGIGGALIVNKFGKNVNAIIGKEAVLTAGENVRISASANDWELLVGITAGSGNAAITGVIPVCVSQDTVTAKVEEGSSITAGGSIGVLTGIDSNLYTAAGGVSVSTGENSGVGIGGTVLTTVNNNKAESLIGDRVTLNAMTAGVTGGVTIPNRKTRRSGIVVYSGGNSDIVSAAVAAAAGSGNTNASAAVSTTVLNNTYRARTSWSASLTVKKGAAATTAATSGSESAEGSVSSSSSDGSSSGSSSSSSSSDGSEDADAPYGIHIITEYEENAVITTDAASISTSEGISGTGIVSTFVSNTTLDSALCGSIYADDNVEVKADLSSNVVGVSVGAAGGKVGVGGVVLTIAYKDHVTAVLDGTVDHAKDISVTADDEIKEDNIAIGGNINSSAGGTGLVVITVYELDTESSIDTDSAIKEAENITVSAKSTENMNADSTGAAGAKGTDAAGAVNVISDHVTTKSWIGKAVNIGSSDKRASDVKVSADHDLELTAVTIYLAIGGDNAVGLAVSVLVDTNTVTAEIRENAVIYAGDVSVTAKTQRNVLDITASLAGSGNIGAAASVSVVVSGNKMPQDLHDMIYAGSLNPEKNLSESLNQNKYTKDVNLSSNLSVLLAGDGQKDVYRTDYNNYGTDSVNNILKKYDDQYLSSINGQTDTELDSSMVPDEADYTMDLTIYKSDFGSAFNSSVTAMIGAGAKIDAKNITVKAEEVVSYKIITGQAAAGGEIVPDPKKNPGAKTDFGAGIGVGVSAVVMNTTINALVSDGADLIASGDISILAVSGVSEKELSTSEVSNTYVNVDSTIKDVTEAGKVSEDGLGKVTIDKAQNKILLIGFAASASGQIGVGFNGAIFTLHDSITALSAGNLNANNITIKTAADYKEVLAVSAGLSAGIKCSVEVNTSVIYYNASIKTGLAKSSKVVAAGTLNVSSEGTMKAQAASANIGAGKVGVAAGAAVIVNKISAITYIGQGVSVEAGAVAVSNTFVKDSKAYGITGGFGQVGVGVSAVVVVDKLDAAAIIGRDTNYYYDADSEGLTAKAMQVSGETSVKSDITGDIKILGIPCSGGEYGANALVTVAINKSKGLAEIIGKRLETGSLNITAVLSGNVSITDISLTVYYAGAGVVVAVAKQESTNRAVFDLGGKKAVINRDLTVSAGEMGSRPSYSDVTVKLYGASGELFGGNVYLSFAFNAAVNEALIKNEFSDGTLSCYGNANVLAYGESYAYSFNATGTVNGVGGGAVIAYAKINSVQNAGIYLNSTMMVEGNLTVTSMHNDQAPGTEWNLKSFFGDDLLEQLLGHGTKDNVCQAAVIDATASAGTMLADLALSKANASSNAYVKTNNLTVNGSLFVKNKAQSSSSAKILSMYIGGGTFGTAIAHAYADGNFNAYVKTGASLQVNGTGGIYVLNDYISNCTTDLTPCSGSIDESVGKMKVDFAYARSATDSSAYISSGSKSEIISGGDIEVTNKAETKAFAIVRSRALQLSLVSLLADVSRARVGGTQLAYVKGGSVQAGNLRVRSFINTDYGSDSTSYTEKPETGAYAIGGVPVVSITLAQYLCTYAEAINKMNVATSVACDNITAKGNVEVYTAADVYAKAEHGDIAGDVSFITIPVGCDEAETSGSFLTYLNDENGLTAKNVIVKTDGIEEVHATVTPAGGHGTMVSITGASLNVNWGDSIAEAAFSAEFRGKGSLKAESLSVLANSKNQAEANTLEKTNVTINALDVKAVVVKADLNTHTTATMHYNGLADLTGNLTVKAVADNNVISKGGLTQGLKVNLLDGTGLEADAYSDTQTIAQVSGTGTMNVGGNVEIVADNDADVDAVISNPDGSYNLIVGIQVYLAYVHSKDETSVTIRGIHIKADGNINISSKNNSCLKAKAEASNSFAIGSGTGGTTKAYIGESESEPELSQVTITYGADLQAKGSVKVTAENNSEEISTLGAYDSTLAGGFLTFTFNDLCNHTYLKTVIRIEDGSKVISNASDVIIKAGDYAKERAVINKDSIGVVLDADRKETVNELTQNVLIDIQNSAIKAAKDVYMNAYSNASMYAKTIADAKGIFLSGEVRATNNLKRSVLINMDDLAEITSEKGKISVTTTAGNNDDIYTRSEVSTVAGISFDGTSSSQVSYQSSSDIKVGKGVSIKAESGDVELIAEIGIGGMSVTSYDDENGAVTIARALSDINWKSSGLDHVLRARVIINSDPENKATVSGNNVTILAKIGKLYINIDSYASNSGLGGKARAYSRLGFGLDLEVNISNAYVRAKENLIIRANAQNADQYVSITSNAHGGGFIFTKVVSESRFQKANDNVGVTLSNKIGDGVTLAGRDITIDTVRFAVSRRQNPSASKSGLGKISKSSAFDFGDDSSDVYINDGTRFIVDSAVSLCEIEINQDKYGSVSLYVKDMCNVDYGISTSGRFVTIHSVTGKHMDSVVRISGNKNPNGLSKCIIDVNNDMSSCRITNHSDYDLKIDNIGQNMLLDAKPNFEFTNCVSTALPEFSQISEQDQFSITSEKATNVTINKSILWEKGDVLIEWTGSEGGNLTTAQGGLDILGKKYASIWAHTLTVKGAKNVGTADNQAWIYLAKGENGENPEISVNASGDIYLKTSLAEITRYITGSLPDVSSEKLDGRINVKALCAGGTCDFVMDSSLRINYFGYMKALSLYSPLTKTYTQEYIRGEGIAAFGWEKTDSASMFNKEYLLSNEAAVSLSLDNAQYYEIDELSNDSEDAVRLTNGMILYLDKTSHNLLRVVTDNGNVFNASSVSLVDGLIYLSEYGIYYNPESHEISLADDQEAYYYKIAYNSYGQPINLEGFIGSRETILLYDAKYQDFEFASGIYTLSDPYAEYKGYFKWFTDPEKTNGYVAAFDENDNFAGVFRAENLGNNKVSLDEALELNTDIMTGKEFYSRLQEAGVDVSEYEFLADSDQEIVLYTYSDDFDDPKFYVMQQITYYYGNDKGGYTPYEGQYDILFDMQPDQEIVTVEVGNKETEIVKFGLPMYNDSMGYGYIKLVKRGGLTPTLTLRDAADAWFDYCAFLYQGEVQEKFMASGDAYMVADGVWFDSNGLLYIDRRVDSEGMYVEYDVKNQDTKLAETWKTMDRDRKAIAFRSFEYDQNAADNQFSIWGQRQMRLLSDHLALDVNGNVYSYPTGDLISYQDKTIETDAGQIHVRVMNDTRTGNMDLLVIGKDAEGYGFEAEIFKDGAGNLIKAAVTYENGDIYWYTNNNGTWVKDQAPVLVKSAEVQGADLKITDMEGSNVTLEVKADNVGISGDSSVKTNIKADKLTLNLNGISSFGTKDAPISIDAPACAIDMAKVESGTSGDVPVWVTTSGSLTIDNINTTGTLHIGATGNITLNGAETNGTLNVDWMEGTGSLKISNPGDIYVKGEEAVTQVLIDSIESKNGNVTIDIGTGKDSKVLGLRPTDTFRQSITTGEGKEVKFIADQIGSQENPICINADQFEQYTEYAENVYLLVNTEKTVGSGEQIKCRELGIESWNPDLSVFLNMCGYPGGKVYLSSENPVSGQIMLFGSEDGSSIYIYSENGFASDNEGNFRCILNPNLVDDKIIGNVTVEAGNGSINIKPIVPDDDPDKEVQIIFNLIAKDGNITVDDRVETSKGSVEYHAYVRNRGSFNYQSNGDIYLSRPEITHLYIQSDGNRVPTIYSDSLVDDLHSDNGKEYDYWNTHYGERDLKITADKYLRKITSNNQNSLELECPNTNLQTDLYTKKSMILKDGDGNIWFAMENGQDISFVRKADGSGAVLRMDSDEDMILGSVIYKPGTPDKLTIYVPDKYLGRDNAHTGFKVDSNSQVIYVCRQYEENGPSDSDSDGRSGSDGNNDSMDTAEPVMAGFMMSWYMPAGETGKTADASKDYTPNIIAYTYLTHGKVSIEDVQEVIETEEALWKNDPEAQSIAFKQEVLQYRSEIEEDLEDMCGEYGMEELTAETLKELLSEMSQEEKDYYLDLFLRAACIELLLEDTDKAEYYLQLAEIIDPDNYLIAIFRGDIFLQMGEAEKAEPYLNKYLESEEGLDREIKYPLLIAICRINEAEELSQIFMERMTKAGYIYDEEFVDELCRGMDEWQKDVRARYENVQKQ